MKVAFIGLGRMGEAMAERLIDAGHELIVYNRTAAKTAPLVARGARAATSLAEAAGAAPVILSMVADDTALRTITLAEDGLLRSMRHGGVHVVMGTYSVQVVRELAQAHAEAGQSLLSAPVLGRPEAVRAGRLAVMVGGPTQAAEQAMPALEALGRRVFRVGEQPGAAAAIKLANNYLLACAIEAMGEAFALVRKSGASASLFQEVLSDGLFASPAYTGYGRAIADQAWDKVGFTARLGLKDINLAMAAGELAAVPLPSGNVVRDRLLSAIAHGHEGRDWAVMALEQAFASGLEE
jgi:3-hydroxyisobutyrate dehydrogenase-like beta-hydroxyacid dehydrogenase